MLAQGQSLQESFELLDRGKYEEAKTQLSECTPENKMLPAYFFLRARLKSSPSYSHANWSTAYGFILEAKRLFRKKEYTSDYAFLTENKISRLQEDIEFGWLLDLNETSDLAGLSEYIKKYPRAGNREQAIRIQYDLAYEQALREDTPEAYTQFYTNFPEAPQVQEAKRLEHKRAFEKATRENSVEAYKHFMTSYPNAAQLDKAKQLQDTLLYITLLEQDKKIAKAETAEKQAKLDKRETQQIWLIAGVSVLTLSLGFVVFALVRIRKTNNNLRDAHHEISIQKSIIESKNNEIVGSIKYAKYIQNAILPSISAIEEAFQEAFIFYQPKDIVSGDFFWFAEQEGKKIVAVADCTGHGVPGAFMSMIGHTLLHQIVHKEKIYAPNEILDRLKEEIIEALNQKVNMETSHDGMDIAIVCIEGHTLQFSGAHNPGWLVSERAVVLEGDIQPVGKDIMGIDRPFTLKTCTFQKGEMLYLFSDGFSDQFGGKEDRKYSRKRLQRFLQEIRALPCTEQHTRLGKEMALWKGDEEQIDDMLIVGVRL